MGIQLKFNPHDIWIGVYWTLSKSIESPYRDLKIYLCLVPCLPIRFRFEWGWRDMSRNRAIREKLEREHNEQERIAHEMRQQKNLESQERLIGIVGNRIDQ